MATERRASLIIGLLILVQMVGSWLVNFVLQAPLFGAPGFMVTAASHALQISVSVLLGLAVSAISLAIAITAFPIFRQRSLAMAIAFVALATVSLTIGAIENINVRTMLSLSEAYAKAAAADRDHFETLRVVVGGARNWTHYVGLIIAGCTFFMFYVTLFRFALVPRALAGLGIAAVALQIVAVAMPIFGYGIVFAMLAPVGLAQLLTAIWLLAKGFRQTGADRIAAEG